LLLRLDRHDAKAALTEMQAQFEVWIRETPEQWV
jgi:lauroyl/myristoyl acyltransferase